jgi:hypothetical protein
LKCAAGVSLAFYSISTCSVAPQSNRWRCSESGEQAFCLQIADSQRIVHASQRFALLANVEKVLWIQGASQIEGQIK